MTLLPIFDQVALHFHSLGSLTNGMASAPQYGSGGTPTAVLERTVPHRLDVPAGSDFMPGIVHYLQQN